MTKVTDHNQLIPADQAQGCESWQMPDLANENPVSGARASTSQPVGQQNIRVMPLTASKIEALHQQARQEGFEQGKQEGYKAGMAQAKAELDVTNAQLNRIIAQLVHPLADQDKDLDKALVNLAMALAKSVVKTDFEMDTDYLIKVVDQAVLLLPEGSGRIRVLMNPRDAELVRQRCQEKNTDWLIIDSNISQGGCIVKTEHSYIDFTLDQQFQATVDDLLSKQLKLGKPKQPDQVEPGRGAEGENDQT
jgi:flagellar assembly protein FliH